MTAPTADPALDSPPEPLEPASRSPLARLQHVLHRAPALSPLIVLIAAGMVFTYLNSRFLRTENLSLILQQVAVVGALGVGQTIIILTAGIDLSVGALMILVQSIMAQVAHAHHVPGVPALLIGLAAGGVAGALNGTLVTRIRLPPFIVTLGTLNIFTAIGLIYTKDQAVQAPDLPSIMSWTGKTFGPRTFQITTGVVVMLGLYLLFWFVLKNSAWGRHIYAVGDNAEAAGLAGIRVSRVVMSAYVVAGVVYAVTAWIQIGRAGAADPNSATNANLDSITAVVIGGTSLFGGRGVIVGTLIGAVIVGVLRNGLSLAGVEDLYQTLAVGIMVISAVALDQWIRRVGK